MGHQQSSQLSKTHRHHQQIIDRLQAHFEAFRSQHRPRSRVPAELRSATLKALMAGVGPDQLCRACKVEPKQLARWQELAAGVGGGPRKRSSAVVDSPRILSVLSDAVGEAPTVEAGTVEHPEACPNHRGHIDLDVRLGAWRLNLRLNPLPKAGC